MRRTIFVSDKIFVETCKEGSVDFFKGAFGRAAVVAMAAGVCDGGGVFGWVGGGGRGSCEGLEGRLEGALGCSAPSCQPPSLGQAGRQAGCVGQPGSSAADASPHVRGRQWPDGVPLVLIPH